MATALQRIVAGWRHVMASWRNYLPPRSPTSRFFKYLFLLVALGITLKVVFDGFSHYLARRSLDAELEAKKISSLEYLIVLTKRERALIIASLETRCRERNQLALFRTADAELSKKLWQAYTDSIEVKDSLIEQLQKLEPALAAKINVPASIREVNRVAFRLSQLEQAIKPADGVQATDEGYKAVIARLKAAVKDEQNTLVKYAQAFQEARRKFGADSVEVKAVEILEQRLARLKAERERTRQKLGDLEDVLSRYAVWTEALTGIGDNPILDEMAFQLDEDDKSKLVSLQCENLEKYYSKASGKPFRVADLDPTAPKKASFFRRVADFPGDALDWYRASLYSYFSIPPVAQTLFVTLFLGALGALTINVLRLSKIGWWAPQSDPLWGEVTLSPLLGALAAFGIFLLGSAGLLLTTDVKQSGTTSLSAFFIGLLGFISGLLYDEAFGRVRRFGSQLFASDGPVSVATAEDRSLAEVLRTAKASLVADLVLKFGIGARISAEPEFTFLVPSDEAVSRLTVQAWRDISEPISRPKFEVWFRHHHGLKRVTSNDVIGSPAGGTVSEIEVEDGTKYPVEMGVDGLEINHAKVARSDISWTNGVIHILEQEV